jgi:hypothetical protein
MLSTSNNWWRRGADWKNPLVKEVMKRPAKGKERI